MDQLRWTSLADFLSRLKSEGRSVLRRRVSRPRADQATLDVLDEVKGPLGLTSIHNPIPPLTTIADIVFIHGLGGGSRKSWSYSPDLSHFWPQQWLPQDEGFQDVRIHVFGYDADWSERRQTPLTIHDFSTSLLNALKNDPSIRLGGTQIVLVCHSMGGCIAKKAYLSACKDPTCHRLAKRIHSIFFLGTPHHGSNLAAMLNTILTTSGIKKSYVGDLEQTSQALVSINDDFRHVAPALRLWSFYETLPVRARFIRKMVVDKHSATLGYANEEVAPMHADHRHVCKFDTPKDPNYRMLRNSLNTAIDLIRNTPSSPSRPESLVPRPIAQPNQLARLRSFLDIHNTFDADFATLQNLREPGSGTWFFDSKRFGVWKTGSPQHILWLTGLPGSGKSVLSCHVVEKSRSPIDHCSYFFYKNLVDGKSHLHDSFRSLAFQMAAQDQEIMDKLLQLEIEGVVIDNTDDLSLWRKLFVGCIFKAPSVSHHIWVLDGVDECANFSALFTKKFLSTLPMDLRVFAASRNLDIIDRGLTSLGPRVDRHMLSESDTFDDMRLFLSKKLTELDRLDRGEDREAMCEKILRMANGSFLWLRLVLQEFEHAWTEEAMNEVLNEVPAGLHDMYSRMVHSIEGDARRLALARSILLWTAVASRPLSLDELCCAVKLDLNQTLHSSDKAIPSLCGQLVFVDQDNKVHLIHETTREFLVSDCPSPNLAVDEASAHAHLCLRLLRYLCKDWANAIREQHQGPTKAKGFVKAQVATDQFDKSLVDYACTFFSDHLYKSSSTDNDLTDELCTFFRGNHVLDWIDYVAKSRDLSIITRTAMNLRGHLARIAEHTEPTNTAPNLIDSWVTDLIRVTAKFRSQLLTYPSSIHSMIPALCPPDSMISRAMPSTSRPFTLVVKGMPSGTWDDCLSRIDIQKEPATALCHGNRYFAIGSSTGQIWLYDSDTIQNRSTMAHGERIRFLLFSPDDRYLMSCGPKNLIFWSLRSLESVYSFPIQGSPLQFAFMSNTELLGSLQPYQVVKWDLDTGRQESVSWAERGNRHHESLDSPRAIPDVPPSRAAFMTATDEVLLAVGYRIHRIHIWNVLDLQLLGTCSLEGINGIDDMTFNPNPEIPVLVVSYNDGRLCLFNYLTMASVFTKSNAFAMSLSCSQDGRTLASGECDGIINVFNFDKDSAGQTILVPIYRVKTLDDFINRITFSPDGLRILDLQSRQCQVWSPAALVRNNNESQSASKALTLAPTTKRVFGTSLDPDITSPLSVSSDGQYIIVGKSGGVSLFSTEDGRDLGVLYQHSGRVSVKRVVIREAHNLVISADDFSDVLVAELPMPLSNLAADSKLHQQKLPPSRILLSQRAGVAVRHLLVNESADRILIISRKVTLLWELPSGRQVSKHNPSSDQESTSQSPPNSESAHELTAFQHPKNEAWFVIVAGDIARIFSWEDHAELTAKQGIQLQRAKIPSSPVRRHDSKVDQAIGQQFSNLSRLPPVLFYHTGPQVVVESLRYFKWGSLCLTVWPTAVFDPASSVAKPLADENLSTITPMISAVVGILGTSTLVFLDNDMWVCSVNLETLGDDTIPETGRSPLLTAHAQRHFFALSEWREADKGLNCTLVNVSRASVGSKAGDVAFAHGHRLIVVKQGFKFAENVIAVSREEMNTDHENGVETHRGRINQGGQSSWVAVSESIDG